MGTKMPKIDHNNELLKLSMRCSKDRNEMLVIYMSRSSPKKLHIRTCLPCLISLHQGLYAFCKIHTFSRFMSPLTLVHICSLLIKNLIILQFSVSFLVIRQTFTLSAPTSCWRYCGIEILPPYILLPSVTIDFKVISFSMVC